MSLRLDFSTNPETTEQVVTITSGEVVTLPALHPRTTVVIWQLTGGNVRATFDGSGPTTTSGWVLSIGSSDRWSNTDAQAAKLIAEGATAYLRIRQCSNP